MTATELRAHLDAARSAIPATAVSALNAFDSAMAEIGKNTAAATAEIERLAAFEKTIRTACIHLGSPGAIIIEASATAPASPPRLALVRNAEAKAAFDAALARGEGQS